MSKDRKLRRCVMPGCQGERFDLVHKFPMDNDRAQEWCRIINVSEIKNLTLDQLRKRCFVCSKHFRKEDYKNCESRSLNKTAYPSLILGPQSGLQSAEAISFLKADPVANIEQQINLNDLTSIMPSTEDAADSLGYDLENLTTTPSSQPLIRIQIQPDLENLSAANDWELVDKVANVRSVLNENMSTAVIDAMLKSDSTEAQVKRKAPVRQTVKNQISANGMVTAATLMDVPPQKQLKPDDSDLVTLASGDFQTESSDHVSTATNNVSNRQESVKNDIVPTSDTFSVNKALKITSMTTENMELKCADFAETLNLNFFWLRDHCRCNQCYSETTHQRKFNILDISENVRPKKIVFQKKDVVITWDDDHVSTFNMLDLHKMQHSEFLKNFQSSSFITKTLWNNAEVQSSTYARVSLNEYLSSDIVAKELLSSLLTYGFAFIENVPTNLPSTELAIKRLFSVRKTIFGEMYSFTDAKDHEDSAYSTEGLMPHTDNTYFNDPAGLQVLHCLEHTGTGGDTMLVDGFRAIDQLRKKNPDAFEWLCTANVPAEYIESGQHFKHCEPIIKLEPVTGELLQIRFNLNDRSALNTLPQQQMTYFYRSIRALAAEIQSPDNEWRFKLRPGTIVIFDNWRVLHGRTAYTGRRQMVGCYVTRSDFLSVVRRMKVLD